MTEFIQIPESQAVNMRLGEVEVAMGATHLRSMPRNLGIVIGNGCNIDCPHCYQVKTGDNLFRDAEIGSALRREFAALYPFLSTLRIQGGEVFALRGFSELVEDVSALTNRPLISISTNATLITAEWAERIVDTPFQHMTVSMDAARPETYAKLRRGGNFEVVVGNIERLQALKRERGSGLPTIDSFFVLMRANFREVPEFLELMHRLGIYRVSFQTMLTDSRNLSREPWLADEVIQSDDDVQELHALLVEASAWARAHRMQLNWSGVRDLFEKAGLSYDFLNEEQDTLVLERDVGAPSVEEDVPVPGYRMPQDLPELPASLCGGGSKPQVCTNPWYTMFVAENGDVSLCFLSDPVGNLFQTPLIEIWNCPAAIAKRTRMLAGRYLESGCSSLWCSWRDGKLPETPDPQVWAELLDLFKVLNEQLQASSPDIVTDGWNDTKLRSVRRAFEAQEDRIKELEANLAMMWDDNGHLHQKGREQLDKLEGKIERLRGILDA